MAGKHGQVDPARRQAYGYRNRGGAQYTSRRRSLQVRRMRISRKSRQWNSRSCPSCVRRPRQCRAPRPEDIEPLTRAIDYKKHDTPTDQQAHRDAGRRVPTDRKPPTNSDEEDMTQFGQRPARAKERPTQEHGVWVRHKEAVTHPGASGASTPIILPQQRASLKRMNTHTCQSDTHRCCCMIGRSRVLLRREGRVASRFSMGRCALP